MKVMTKSCPPMQRKVIISLQWRHNGRDSVSNHQPHDCLLNRLFRRRSKKTSKLRVTGLCAGNSPGTGEFPAQMASYAENVSIWWRWRHHVTTLQRYSYWIKLDCHTIHVRKLGFVAWQPCRAVNLLPCHVVKFLQLIWRLHTQRLNLPVSDRQMNSRDLA